MVYDDTMHGIVGGTTRQRRGALCPVAAPTATKRKPMVYCLLDAPSTRKSWCRHGSAATSARAAWSCDSEAAAAAASRRVCEPCGGLDATEAQKCVKLGLSLGLHGRGVCVGT